MALVQYLTFSFVPAERTMLTGVREVPAGHSLRIDTATGEAHVERWFVHEEEQAASDGDTDVWVTQTRNLVETAVADRLPANRPVAALLSGGLDSSIVATVAARQRRVSGHARPITFCLHFGPDHPNELHHARAVADHARTDHHEVRVRTEEIDELLPGLVWHLDEPIGDPVTLGNLVLARAAADHSDWVLNGEGGDPVFGGPKNLPMLLAHWYAGPEPGTDFRVRQYLATWRRAGEDVQNLLHPDLRELVDLDQAVADVVRPHLSAESGMCFLNKLMVANMRLKGAHLILPKVDRLMGGHGLTPLSPLFDPSLIRLSLRMPPRAKLSAGVEKRVLKLAFAEELPPAVVARAKSGMRVPVHHWFQAELQRSAAELLSPREVRRAGIFDARRVRDLRRYRTGRDGIRLWMLVTFELWRRQVIGG